MALKDDLTLALEAKTLRLEAPAAGRPYVSLELSRKDRQLVSLRELLESKEYQVARAKSKLALALGRDVAGRIGVSDLAAAHLLIAGEPESGKSTLVQSFLATILMQATPDDVRLLLIDPNMDTLSLYNGIPHLLSPVVIEVEKVVGLFKIAIAEMERRYRLFSQLGVRKVDGYRKLRAERLAHGDQTLNNLPAIVIIIDELADIMRIAAQEVEDLIDRLAQRGRATGIHLIIVTERPSRTVMTGLMKAMLPTRLSLKVSTSADSRTILGMDGAERLLGRGDLLYLPAEASQPERIQGAFVADEEAERLVQYWRLQAAQHSAAEGQASDDLLGEAEAVVREYERASISLLQRRLKIGYSRAARLIDLLEERGVISRAEPGGKAREVLEQRGPAPRYSGGSKSRTLADEAVDIMEEERLRAEALKRQAERDG
jgi:DNA segregation ATPase FtsK/SpoIIIE-like protein